MIPESVLNVLQCALSSDKHIVTHPVTIPCGHTVCRSCLLVSNSKLINCLECGKIIEIDLNNSSESNMLKITLKAYIEDLFKVVSDKMNNSLRVLKGNIITSSH